MHQSFFQICKTSQSLSSSYVTVMCSNALTIGWSTTKSISLSLSLSLMKLPTFFCHLNHPTDFHPVLRTVIAHRCVMSAFVAIIPRPLIVGGQIFPSFLICHRRREGGERVGVPESTAKCILYLAACTLLHIFQTGTLCLLHAIMTIC